MKLQIDTTEKIIRIEERVNLGDLYSELEKLLPKGAWREFQLDTQTKIDWTQPIIYPIYPTYPTYPDPTPINPYQPPYYPWITWCNGTTSNGSELQDFTLNYGVYNVVTPN
jgi:hypothetical protein